MINTDLNKCSCWTRNCRKNYKCCGRSIDEKGDVKTKEKWPIHRPAPKFTDQATETEQLVTGIKVIDLLAPYAKVEKLDYLEEPELKTVTIMG